MRPMKIYAKKGIIVKTRILKGYSQREFARQLGLSHAYISLLERSIKCVGPATAKKISDLLDKSIEDLFVIE